MIEAIQVAVPDIAQATAAAPGAARPQATAIEVGQFSAAYANGGAAAGGASTTPAAAQTQEPSEVARAVGEYFNKLNNGAEEVRDMAAKLSAADDQTRPSMMMQMTFASQMFLFKSELTSNIANRTSDGIQQLFRQQS